MAYEDIFMRVARKHGLDWRLMAEQCFRESRFDPLAVGPATELGLMQFPQAAWGEWSARVGVYDPFDPESNIAVAGACLAWIKEQLAALGRPEPHWMLVAYNWGIDHVLHLLQAGGRWDDVPQVMRSYADGIVLAAESSTVAHPIAPDRPPAHQGQVNQEAEGG